jgi:hypothetical protein
MSEDETKLLKDTHKMLEQVVTKLEVLDTRLQHVESKIEQRGFDTKPIWEQALVEIMEVRREVKSVNLKIDVFSKDMLNLRAEQLETQQRLDRLEAQNEDGGVTTIQ